MDTHTKFIIWTVLIITSTSCHEVTETQEETDNITTLYPIRFNSSSNGTQSKTLDSWKTGTSYSETLNKDGNKTESKEEPVIEKPGNDSQEFKPSVHLGDFFDEDSFGTVPLPTKPSFDAFSPLKKPPSAFIGSHKDEHKLIHKPKTHEKFPYKFEDAILTRAKSKWRPTPGLESRPTSTVPVEVPAGGLYKKPDAFKDKPGFGGDDEEFGLEFNDEKETFVKKRANPWKGLLHLLVSLIPVGIIVSALTPRVITIQDTGPGPGYSGFNEPLPPRLYRRSSEAPIPPPAPSPPTISEPCRRRLLCELHSRRIIIATKVPRPAAARATSCAATSRRRWRTHCDGCWTARYRTGFNSTAKHTQDWCGSGAGPAV
ncbi:uncharacterized protein isoform X2 [Choristoneura fumiferana]|uniref:uncharacterized protein isoform X2 n=1 Tax=Choristoneura fumiferana TaxID=7141 RepID=UPI003D15DB3E